MNDIPGLNFLPEKWRGWVVLAIGVSPYATRAWHAFKQSELSCYQTVTSLGGLKTIMSAVWLGTNVPRKSVVETKN